MVTKGANVMFPHLRILLQALTGTMVCCPLLMACSSLDFQDPKRAACNFLKSEIVMRGATSDMRKADIEKAEEPLQRRAYDINNC